MAISRISSVKEVWVQTAPRRAFQPCNFGKLVMKGVCSSGVGLDVYEDEPKTHDGLLRNQKVMLLPHMGTWTTENQYQMELCAISNIREAIEKGKLLSPIQEQIKLYRKVHESAN